MWNYFQSFLGSISDWGLTAIMNKMMIAAIATLLGVIGLLGSMLYMTKQSLHTCELKKASCFSALAGEEHRTEYGNEMCREVQEHCRKKIELYKKRILDLEESIKE